MKHFFLVINLLFTIGMEVISQNTSYSANTIPINGTNSTAFGFEALKVNAGGFNTASGYRVLFSNTTGSANSSYGYRALYSNTTGEWNSAFGALTLHNNKEGIENVAHGTYSLYYNQGSYNSAVGVRALGENITGNSNAAFGAYSQSLNNTGRANTAMGNFSLQFNSAGNNNVAVGDSAGMYANGNGNVFLGSKAGANEIFINNKFYLGNSATNTLIYGDFASKQVLLGNANPQGYIFKGNRTLNVVGGILTDSLRVSPSANWADYVFDDTYSLKSLVDLRTFIKTYKRLPNIPSAKDVAKDGIELSTMNIKLLEKIEELTLYILQQQDELENFKKRLLKLENK